MARVEAFKYWQKPVTIVVLAMMFFGPIIIEILLASFSMRDATFPRIAQFMFAPDTLLIIALMTVVVSVLALGVDYELGTVPVILSRGVERYQFILAKIIPTVLSAWLNGIVFIAAGMVSIFVVHVLSDSAPFFTAAGEHTRVAFEVDDVDERTRSGWSVLVQALGEEVIGVRRTELIERLHAAPGAPWAPGEHGHWIRLIPRIVTGRRIVPGQLPPPFEDAGYL